MSDSATEQCNLPSPPALCKPTTFLKFQQLPPELQTQIWRESLGGDIRHSALYTWRPGCWGPASRTQFDPEYRSPNGDDRNLLLKFFHERLGYTQLYIPMAFVNAEACNIAFTWATEHNIEMRAHADGDGSMFVCPFHPECDILYVSPADWCEFISEPQTLPYELNIFADQFYAMRTAIRQIAVSESVFREPALREQLLIRDLELSHPAVQCLYVVVDPPPDARSSNGDSSVPWRLEVEKAQGWELVWVIDHEGIRREDSFVRSIKTAHGVDEGLHRCLAGASMRMHERYMENIPKASTETRLTRRFEIRIAHIVKVG